MAIELGENFTEYMKNKYGTYSNFNIVNADFGNQTFDLIYSAATIQCIPEGIAFSKAYNILKPDGIFAMFMNRSDEKSALEAIKLIIKFSKLHLREYMR